MDTYTRPDANRAALLTIDTQNDFTLPGAPAEIPGTADAVPEMERLVSAFRSVKQPVIHVVRLYEADGSNVDQCRKQMIEEGTAIVRPGTDGAELVEDLKPSSDVELESETLLDGSFQAVGPAEWLLYKPRWGAFYDTELDAFLTEQGVNTVVVCGCNFPNCPRTTIYEASERDYRIVIVPEATSGTYERGLNEVSNIGVAIRDIDETIDWLTA